MKKIFCFFVLPFFAFAESAEGFPSRMIFFQVLNFSVFFILLIFFLRSPVRKFFKKRQEDFLSFEKEAREKEKEMEKSNRILKEKIADIEARQKTIRTKAEEEGQKYLSEKQREKLHKKESLEREGCFFLQLEERKLKKNAFEKWKRQIVQKTEEQLKQEDPRFQKQMVRSFFRQMEKQL